MTTFSKVLAVAVTIFCLAFVGVAGVAYVGGPNWEGRARDLDRYNFENSGGEQPKWSATDRIDGQAVGAPDAVLPKKIIDALKDEKADLATQISRYDTDNRATGWYTADQYKAFATEAEKLLLQDIQALENYEQGLRTELAAVNEEIRKAKLATSTAAQAAGTALKEAERLRDDIYRIQNLIAEVQTDTERTIAHQKKLRDVLERYQGTANRLELRRDQMKKRLTGESADNAGTTPTTADAADQVRQ